MADKWGDVPAVANHFSGDVFADEAVGFENLNGTIRITFAVAKMIDPIPPSGLQMVNIGRLVIGPNGAQNLAVGLFNFLKDQGFDMNSITGSGKAN